MTTRKVLGHRILYLHQLHRAPTSPSLLHSRVMTTAGSTPGTWQAAGEATFMQSPARQVLAAVRGATDRTDWGQRRRGHCSPRIMGN